MITCTVTIKEVPGKGFYVDVVPDQTHATLTEMRVATCLNAVLDAVGEYLMTIGQRGEMIEGDALGVVRDIAARKIKEFES